MRTLAIDYGDKRTGLALSDAGGKFASPLDTIHHGDPRLVEASVLPIVAREGVERVVIGLPLGPDGGLNPASKRNIAFGRSLAQKTGVALAFVDEHLSTYDADQRLTERKRAGGKLTRQMRKERLDAVAAAIFLQRFLDGELPSLAIDDSKR